MLDQQHGVAAFQALEQGDQALAFFLADTGERLVEQDRRRLERQRHGDLQRPLLAMRQAAGRDMGTLRQADRVESGAGRVVQALVIGGVAEERERMARLGLHTERDVLQR